MMETTVITLQTLNAMPEEEAARALERCCGATRWVQGMLARRPFQGMADLLTAADTVWNGLERTDWLEAFAHHPKIGDVNSLREKFANTRQWAAGEQSGVQAASEETLHALSEGNALYEARFGYIFIVCAAGKTADEMLALLQARLNNDPDSELRIAAAEQAKITRLRLEKLLASEGS